MIVFIIFCLSFVVFSYLYILESMHGITRVTLGSERKQESIGPVLRGGFAMAVDVINNKLFVCDGLHQISMMDLNGSNQITIKLNKDKNCSAVAVHGSTVYYSIAR